MRRPFKDLSSSVCIGFLGSGKNPYFRPSLNLASEEVDLSLKEYRAGGEKLHKQTPLLQIRDLGSSSCKMGPSHLLELILQNPLRRGAHPTIYLPLPKKSLCLNGSAAQRGIGIFLL